MSPITNDDDFDVDDDDAVTVAGTVIR